MKTEFWTACDQLVAAAANGIYQGIIVTVLVALGLRVLGRINAATRHAVWFCTLLLLVFLLVAHCLMGPLQGPVTVTPSLSSNGGESVRRTSEGDAGRSSVPTLDSERITGFDSQRPLTPSLFPGGGEGGRLGSPESDGGGRTGEGDLIRFTSQMQGHATAEARPLTLSLSPDGGEGIRRTGEDAGQQSLALHERRPLNPSFSSDGGEGARSNPVRWPALAERLVNPISMNLALGSKVPRFASAILAALWLLIAGFRMLALLLQLVRIQKLKQRALPPGQALQERFQRLVARLALTRKVELKVSPAHPSSFLLGFARPVILLPAESRMEPGEADLLLRHELAHAERRDDWANLVQHSILALCFFHPAVWWISKQLSLEREIACDDHVLQQSRQPHAYALLLATLAARMQRGLPLLAPGSSNHKTQLKQRIDMILNTHRNASPRLVRTWLALITSAAAVVAAAIICSAPRIVLAQNDTSPAKPDAPSADAAANGIAALPLAPEPPDVPRAPGAVVSGPKSKPGSPNVFSARTAVIVAPAVPPAPAAASVVVAQPVPPTPALAAVQSAPEPRPPRPIRAPRAAAKDASLEERLERLEQMVESLLAQRRLQPGYNEFQLKEPAGKDMMIDRKEIERIEQTAKRQAEVARKQIIDSKEMEKIRQQAEREAARAVEQAKRATLEADKALKGEHKVHTARKSKDGSQKQLEALRKQLEILEREREKLDRQIEQLEHDQEQLDELLDEELDLQFEQLEQLLQEPASSVTHPPGPKEECEVTKPAAR